MDFNLKNFLEKINLNNKDNYSKKTVIWDKICPRCKNFIFGSDDFCTCGYSMMRERTIKLWSIVGFTWIFIIAFVFFIFNSFSELNSIVYKKIEKKHNDLYSLSPANVQIIMSLKNSKYINYIQTIYVNPLEKNKLMVLIRPVYWDMLPLEEKNLLKHMIMRKWSEIYQNTTPASKLKPEVHLANFR